MTVKGVIVAAGYGTRFLPVTRCVPKELLPLVDRPALDFVVQELIGAGIEDVLVITSRRKRALEDWFDRDPELEAVFEREQAYAKLALARPPAIRATFVRQQKMGGTGDALLLARDFAGDDPVVVVYPDDLFASNASAELVATWQRTGCSVLAAADLSGSDVSRYGVLEVDVEEAGGADLRVRSIVEKPRRGTEPSSIVSLGRYLFTPELFELLAASHASHEGGEFYPMDAMCALAERGRLVAHVVQGARYDTGAPLGYVQTVVEAALAHPELAEPFAAWLKERASRA